MSEKSVIKHSATVQVSNKINLLQRRAWNILLANAYEELSIGKTHQVRIKDLKEVLRLKSKNDKHLKNLLKALMSCVVEFNVLGKDNKTKWDATTLLAHVGIENGICTYEYSSFLRKKLFNPDVYARISLSIQNKFDSKHALSLYELCVDYYIAKRKYGTTPFIDLEKFKKLMGFDKGKYKQFRDINKFVIKPATKEINEKSDLFVEVEYRREGRKVVALKLYIKPHPKNKNPVLSRNQCQALLEPVSEEISNPELYKRLQQYFCLSPAQAQEVLRNHNKSDIKENLRHVERRYAKGEVENIGAYTLKAIQENITDQLSLFDAEKQEQEAKQKKEQALEKLKEQLETEYDNLARQQAEAYKESLPEDEFKQINEEIWQEVKDQQGKNTYGLKTFHRLALTKHLAGKAGLPAFKEWREKELERRFVE